MIDRTVGADVVFDFNFNDVSGWFEFFNVPILFGSGFTSPNSPGSIKVCGGVEADDRPGDNPSRHAASEVPL